MKDLKKTTLSPILKREKVILAELPSAIKRVKELESELTKIRKIKTILGQLYPEPKQENPLPLPKTKNGWKVKRFKGKISVDTAKGLPKLTPSEKKLFKILLKMKAMGQKILLTKDIKKYNERSINFTDGMLSVTLTQLKQKNRLKNIAVGKWEIIKDK